MIAPIFFSPTQVLADPPAHAPAHGYHKKKHKHHDHHHYAAPATFFFPSAPRVDVNCAQGTSIIGSVVGGVAGGLIGNQFGKGSGNTAATIGGTIAGTLIGQSIGDSLSTGCAAQALEYAKSGTQVAWNNPDREESYAILPKRTFTNTEGRYCREYQTRIYVGGKLQEGYGTACRTPDGSWETIRE